ncbi:putative meiosis recombination protein SPO11 [Trypanosoma cruzi]|uniref:Putative meiosis recombination protein SPO11 n=1 Tax=Trypanosoma cruzi TaxID=5693 RepID=A0A2V2WE59_TRYCR|nr:putative meiosis recombination protein SPO11 [Trypanosoma cruzi]
MTKSLVQRRPWCMRTSWSFSTDLTLPSQKPHHRLIIALSSLWDGRAKDATVLRNEMYIYREEDERVAAYRSGPIRAFVRGGHVHQGLTCTERDVYYQNTSLFRNGQRDVHTSIENLCRWMDSTHPLGNADDPRVSGADATHARGSALLLVERVFLSDTSRLTFPSVHQFCPLYLRRRR